MATPPAESVTQLLQALSQGHTSAQKELWSLIYEELHGLARGQMAKEPAGLTLQSTALVHEAYLRLIGDENVQWANRRHFFGAAANAMRRIRIDDARRRGRQKRGGGQQRVPIDEANAVLDQDPAQVLAIDEALTKLEQADPRKAEVVMLRYFAGLSVDETAEALGVAPRTVDSEWRFAKAWLHRELKRGDTSDAG